LLAALGGGAALAQQAAFPDAMLRVCADPHELPASDQQGNGYENKIAAALARDLNLKLEYTWFPQRVGFVRQTLGAHKCDVIIGVPTGYPDTATTVPYMRSTYALVFRAQGPLAGLKSAEGVTKLPSAKLQALHIGVFALTPASNWAVMNGMTEQMVTYPPQSGDPMVTSATIIDHDLGAGKIDAAILWGPIAGYLVTQHASGPDRWEALPFKPDPSVRFDYEISMGLRGSDTQLMKALNDWIAGHRAEIGGILAAYHLPLLPLTGSGR
ncbi:MAG TPA: quinoprotein dehydrogenase-associated putative ABC transporter substrate-binding protein, partial [Gemmatimonadales bacterium]|nr:quinoprotein dehydrogenase-associated putative ABC transporter substrate-binding protein [Gemmatimonadales bacterium]